MTVRIWIAALGMCLAAAVGCQSDHHSSDTQPSDRMMSASHDDCSHCAGVQVANANGKCPICGAQVK